MENLIVFDDKARKKYLNPRAGELKLGEQINLISTMAELEALTARYVIVGIPEDIGIRANYGKPGAAQTWEAFLSAFLNIQVNAYNAPEKCVILGCLDCRDYKEDAERVFKEEENPYKKWGAIVEEIDAAVTAVVRAIVKMGKIPIIIGGGHNNSYGNIKGTALALDQPVNILNIDAHTDLRRPDYRHSGNGFSYALKEGFLKRYTMFGIHKNYTPQYIFDEYNDHEEVEIILYEDIMGGDLAFQQQALQRAIRDLKEPFGLELDTDSVAHFNSSAKTPSGFSIPAIRHFIGFLKTQNILYFHLAEAADSGDGQVGKTLSYWVSDFIR